MLRSQKLSLCLFLPSLSIVLHIWFPGYLAHFLHWPLGFLYYTCVDIITSDFSVHVIIWTVLQMSYSFKIWANMASVLSYNIHSRWFFLGCYLDWVPWKSATRAGQWSLLDSFPVLVFRLAHWIRFFPSRDWMARVRHNGRLGDNKQINNYNSHTFLLLIAYTFSLFLLDGIFTCMWYLCVISLCWKHQSLSDWKQNAYQK